MNWQGWLIMCLFCIIGRLLLDKVESKGKNNEKEADYATAYQAKYLLTRNEWHEYKKLRQYSDAKGWIVCPKVRVLDLIEPKKGQKEYRALLNKIQSKHIDFVVCDNDLHIKALIELDDNSHNKEDRAKRDAFLQTILESVGYKVIHTKGITEDTLNFETA